MSDNSPTLGETIEKAVMEFFAENSGMPLAFVAAVDWIDGDGASSLTIRTFENQPTHRSMGMVRYMDAWFADDAQVEMNQAAYVVADDDEDD